MTGVLLLLLGIAAAGQPLWLDVPFVHQEPNGCGSASVWMVMKYWRVPETPSVDEIHLSLYSKEAHGIYGRDIEHYLNERGFLARAFAGEWSDLEEHLGKGRPLIVVLDTARRAPLHYVVVAGIDHDGGMVLVNDPGQRKLLSMRRSVFEREWNAGGNWTLLALPEKEFEVPPVLSEDPTPDSPALSLASDAFRCENFREAQHHLTDVLRSNPNSSYANDFLGASYFLDGNFEAALKYWNRAGKPMIREISVDPPLQIDPILLDHSMNVSRADRLTSRDYNTTRRRLDALGVFSRYEFELTPAPGKDFDVSFRAAETKGPQWLSWFSGLPWQTANPQWTNIAGRALNLQSLVRWDPHKQRAFASLSAPLRQNSSLLYRIAFDARNEDWQRPGENFNLKRTEFAGEIRGIPGDSWSWTAGVIATGRKFTDTRNGGISLSYKASVERMLLRLPEKRLTIDSTLSGQLGKFFERSSERFFKTEGDVSVRWLPGQGRNYESRARFRAGTSFGSIPFDELFLLGLDRDGDLRLRGHSALSAGRKGAAPMGASYILSNFDFSRLVHDSGLIRIQAGPFLDTAHVSSQGPWMFDTGIQLTFSVLRAFTFRISAGRDLRTGRQVAFAESGGR